MVWPRKPSAVSVYERASNGPMFDSYFFLAQLNICCTGCSITRG